MDKQNPETQQTNFSNLAFPSFSIHLWVIKSNKQQAFKHRLGRKVIRPIAVMTPTESCGQDGVSVTPSHHVSQSQQQLVLPARYRPNAICLHAQLWLPWTQNSAHLTQLVEPKVSKRRASDGFLSSCLHAKLNNLNYFCQGGVHPQFFPPSN